MDSRKIAAGRGMTRRGVLGTGSALFAAGLFPLSAGRVFAQGSEKVLRIAHPAFKMDWSPLRGGDNDYRWNSLWWASAMRFDSAGNIHPYVLSKWTPSEDGMSWRLEVDPAAVFSDGSPITAEDVKGSWELAAMPSTRNARIDQVIGTVKGFSDVSTGASSTLSGVTTEGEKTLVVELSEYDPVFFMRIANNLAPIVKVAEARDGNGEEVVEWWHPDYGGGAVSGPFKPSMIDLNSGVLEFEPNENFFGPAPKLSRVQIRTIEDPVAAVALLQSGEMDAHSEIIMPSLVTELGKEFVDGPPIPKGQHFWFNMQRAPFDDAKVREALILAVDRDGLLGITFPDGPNLKADQLLNAVPGVDPDFVPYPFDPARAKQLLAESSYGRPERLPNIMLVGISNPAAQAAAQYIAEQWRQNLGISAVDMKPQADAYSGPDQANVQVFRDDVGTRVPDATAYLRGAIHSASGNAQTKLGGYNNAEIDRLLDEADKLPLDDPGRDDRARQAQEIFRDDYAFLPWYHETMCRWAMPRVTGIDKNLDWQVVEPWNIDIQSA